MMSTDVNDCFLSWCIFSKDRTISEPRNFHRSRAESSLQQIFASILGSSTSTLLLNPLNVVKIKLQYSLSAHLTTRSLSIASTIATIYHQHGYRGFYSGLGMSLLQTMPSTVIYMSSYEQAKARLSSSSTIQSSSSLQTVLPAIAAGIARLLTVSIIAPVELIRTIRTSGSSEMPIAIAQSILRSRGLKGFYAGWSSTVLRDMPYSMIYWLTYERIRYLCSVDNKPSKSSYLIAGSLAGLVAAVITHPFDVLKTQQQLNIRVPSLSSYTIISGKTNPVVVTESTFENSIVRRMTSLLRGRGILSLYSGLSMRLMTVIPSGAIMVTVYEIVKNYDT